MKCLCVLTVLAAILGPATLVADDSAENVVLAIHGGAGVLSKEMLKPGKEREYREKLLEALKAGHAELGKSSGTSLDAVVAAIKVLEDSPLFNAGKGAAFTRDGKNELDASLMDGRSKKAGAVAGVTTIKNPIVGARIVMEKSRHVLMTGRGAELMATENGAEIVDPAYFWTELRWKMLQDELMREKAPPKKPAQGKQSSTSRLPGGTYRFGTVGCVARDKEGNLAAGTSTGGMTLKRSGRLGDSPIIGAATYAKNESCAVSATGDGEYFIRAVAAHDIAALVEYKGLSVAQASKVVIHEKIKSAGGEGGVIVLDVKGNAAFTYSSEGMYRGYVTADGKYHVMIHEK
jgi:beta-aspartyl-peptidase (threonine type)